MDIVEKLNTSLTMSMFLNEADLYSEYAARCREAKDEILKLRAELEAVRKQFEQRLTYDEIANAWYQVGADCAGLPWANLTFALDSEIAKRK